MDKIDFKEHCEAREVFLGSFSPPFFFLFFQNPPLGPSNQPVALGPKRQPLIPFQNRKLLEIIKGQLGLWFIEHLETVKPHA